MFTHWLVPLLKGGFCALVLIVARTKAQGFEGFRDQVKRFQIGARLLLSLFSIISRIITSIVLTVLTITTSSIKAGVGEASGTSFEKPSVLLFQAWFLIL